MRPKVTLAHRPELDGDAERKRHVAVYARFTPEEAHGIDEIADALTREWKRLGRSRRASRSHAVRACVEHYRRHPPRIEEG